MLCAPGDLLIFMLLSIYRFFILIFSQQVLREFKLMQIMQFFSRDEAVENGMGDDISGRAWKFNPITADCSLQQWRRASNENKNRVESF